MKKKKFYKNRYKYIQLHADDIGRSENINSTIFQSIDKGIVRGVSILVGQKYSLKAIKKLKRRRVKMRLHLNLTEGLPSAKHEIQSDLIDQNGNFSMDFISLFFAPLKFGFQKLKVVCATFPPSWKNHQNKNRHPNKITKTKTPKITKKTPPNHQQNT